MSRFPVVGPEPRPAIYCAGVLTVAVPGRDGYACAECGAKVRVVA